jgi:hypothetical protein
MTAKLDFPDYGLTDQGRAVCVAGAGCRFFSRSPRVWPRSRRPVTALSVGIWGRRGGRRLPPSRAEVCSARKWQADARSKASMRVTDALPRGRRTLGQARPSTH